MRSKKWVFICKGDRNHGLVIEDIYELNEREARERARWETGYIILPRGSRIVPIKRDTEEDFYKRL